MLSTDANQNPSKQSSGSNPVLPTTSPVDKYLARTGFDNGQQNTPSGPVPSLFVSSWWQVPQVLARLQSPNQRIIIKFCSQGTPAEIKEIRKFLQGAHLKSGSEMLTELQARLENSAKPEALKESDFTGSADEWMAENGIKRETKVKYAVTDILTVSSAALDDREALSRRLGEAFDEVHSRQRKLVLALEKRDDRAGFGAALQGSIEDDKRGVQNLPISVWMPRENLGTALEEKSLTEFYREVQRDNKDASAPGGSGQDQNTKSADISHDLKVQGAGDVAASPSNEGKTGADSSKQEAGAGADTQTNGGTAVVEPGQTQGTTPDNSGTSPQPDPNNSPDGSQPGAAAAGADTQTSGGTAVVEPVQAGGSTPDNSGTSPQPDPNNSPDGSQPGAAAGGADTQTNGGTAVVEPGQAGGSTPDNSGTSPQPDLNNGLDGSQQGATASGTGTEGQSGSSPSGSEQVPSPDVDASGAGSPDPAPSGDQSQAAGNDSVVGGNHGDSAATLGHESASSSEFELSDYPGVVSTLDADENSLGIDTFGFEDGNEQGTELASNAAVAEGIETAEADIQDAQSHSAGSTDLVEEEASSDSWDGFTLNLDDGKSAAANEVVASLKEAADEKDSSIPTNAASSDSGRLEQAKTGSVTASEKAEQICSMLLGNGCDAATRSTIEQKLRNELSWYSGELHKTEAQYNELADELKRVSNDIQLMEDSRDSEERIQSKRDQRDRKTEELDENKKASLALREERDARDRVLEVLSAAKECPAPPVPKFVDRVGRALRGAFGSETALDTLLEKLQASSASRKKLEDQAGDSSGADSQLGQALSSWDALQSGGQDSADRKEREDVLFRFLEKIGYTEKTRQSYVSECNQILAQTSQEIEEVKKEVGALEAEVSKMSESFLQGNRQGLSSHESRVQERRLSSKQVELTSRRTRLERLCKHEELHGQLAKVLVLTEGYFKTPPRQGPRSGFGRAINLVTKLVRRPPSFSEFVVQLGAFLEEEFALIEEARARSKKGASGPPVGPEFSATGQ